MRRVRERRRDIVAYFALAALGIAVGFYILDHQRLRIPFVDPTPVKIEFEMATAQAVTPGQGQTVRVAGVRVGDIAEVELRDGRAIIVADIDEEYADLVRTDATAFLRPKTGLKDMFIELDPGSPKAPQLAEGGMVPISNTLPDVNPDEILAGLDRDTRDYLRLLLDGAGRGLDGRGEDLREVFRRFEPTYRDLARVSSAGARSRKELRRLVHSLNRLYTALGSRDDDLAQLVQNSSRVFTALAEERQNVTGTVRELPSTLKTATNSFARVSEMADLLGPTVEKLRPAVRSLEAANEATAPFYREAEPQLRKDIRPFVRAMRPVAKELAPAAEGLAEAEPGLTTSVEVLNHLFNMIGYNPNPDGGAAQVGKAQSFLFYLSWVTHQSANLFSNADAHSPLRPISVGGNCAVIRGMARNQPELEMILGLTGVLTDPAVCGQGSQDAAKRKAGKR